MTHTVVTLELSYSAYEEIHREMVLAGYDQAVFRDANGKEHVDMTHIAITKKEPPPRRVYSSWDAYDQPENNP